MDELLNKEDILNSSAIGDVKINGYGALIGDITYKLDIITKYNEIILNLFIQIPLDNSSRKSLEEEVYGFMEAPAFILLDSSLTISPKQADELIINLQKKYQIK